MRTRRRFLPSVEFMCARIVPSTTGVNDPTADGANIPTTPIVDTNDLSTAPTVDDANLLIIAPTTTTTNPTSTVC
ncbi:MAG: hypothetical protein ACYC61_03620 [Isosphaeraceae bacterium]